MQGIMDRLKKMFEGRLKIFGPFSIMLVLGFVLGLASLIIFVVLVRGLLYNNLAQFDQTITSIIRSNVSIGTTQVMRMVSNLGSPTALSIISVVLVAYLYFIKKHFWDALQVPVVALGSYILNEVLKYTFHRQRPYLMHLAEATGLSFPSGHSMVGLSFYGIIIYLTWLNSKIKVFNTILTIALSLLIIAIGISRIYLGVHYPSDVLAGFAAGGFWLMFNIYAFKAVRYYKSGK